MPQIATARVDEAGVALIGGEGSPWQPPVTHRDPTTRMDTLSRLSSGVIRAGGAGALRR